MTNYNDDFKGYKHYYQEEYLRKYGSHIGKSKPASSGIKEIIFIFMMIFGIITAVGIPPIGALIIMEAYKIRES